MPAGRGRGRHLDRFACCRPGSRARRTCRSRRRRRRAGRTARRSPARSCCSVVRLHRHLDLLGVAALQLLHGRPRRACRPTTADTGTCALRPAARLLGVTAPAVWPPSENRTTTAGGRCPTAPRTERRDRHRHATASASAVPCGPALARLIAARTEVGSRVGACDDGSVVGEGDHRHPIALRQLRRRAARGRLRRGEAASAATSFAAIEPETSSTSTTVASCRFTVIVAFGRAKPTSSSAAPTSSRPPGDAGASRRGDPSCSAEGRRGPPRCALVAAPLEPDDSPHRRRHDEQEDEQDRRLEAHRTPPSAQERSERPQPVALGRERHVADARRGERC